MILDFPSTDFSRRLAKKFGYDEFIVRRWCAIFGEKETEKLILAMENVPKYIRVNTIKISQDELISRLEERGFLLSKTEVPYCYEIKKEPYSIGATPEYLMGYYYIMDKSSCIPPLALEPKNEIIADLTASPGGKTTMISMLMENRGCVIAVEANKERIQPLIDNIHRMLALNVVVLEMDATKFPKIGIKPDKILLDAPCSGEGIIHKDKTRKVSRGERDILFCSTLQKKLLEAAIISVKEGGVVVYSTCSLTPEENEFVIDEICKKYDLKLENINYGDPALTKVGDIKFDKQIKKARRFYPHRHRCSGFFVAKLIKD